MFGQLIDGFETLEQIEKDPVDKGYRPLNKIAITDFEIHANPLAEIEISPQQPQSPQPVEAAVEEPRPE